MTTFPKGSEWRKWDLQVQTILDDGYISIEQYWDKLKTLFPEKCNQLVQIIGSEDLIKQHDSKEYFFTDKTGSDVKAQNYSKLFLNYIDIFIDNPGAICLTDHNYEHEHLMDAFIKESQNTMVKVIPGIEINVQGVHMLVLLKEIPFGQQTYSKGIKSLLTKLDIDSSKNNGVLTVSHKSYTDVVKMLGEIGGLLIYPHCNSSNGLFQERGKTDRTYLADQFNAQEINILQSRNNTSVKVTSGYIDGNENLKSGYTFTLGSDARCLRDVFAPDEDENFCWIKADLTFEGLKQIIYEPEERIKIQQDNPESKKKHHKIKSLTISNSQNAFLVDQELLINSGLVSLIGGRGSGKTALLNILNLFNSQADTGFIEWLKERGDADLKCVVIDKDGEDKEYTTKISHSINESLPIYYLSQNDIETFSKKSETVREEFLSALGITEYLHYYNDEITKAERLIEELKELDEEEQKINELYEEKSKSQELDWNGFSKYYETRNGVLMKQKEKYSTEETKGALEEISKLSARGINLKKLNESPIPSEIKNMIIILNQKIDEYNYLLTNNQDLKNESKKIIKYDLSQLDQPVQENSVLINSKLTSLRELVATEIAKLQKLGIKDYKNITEAIESINRERLELEKVNHRIQSIFKRKEEIQKELSFILPIYKTKIENAIQDIKTRFQNFREGRDNLFESVFSNISVTGAVYFDHSNFVKLLSEKFLSKKEKHIEELRLKLKKNDHDSFFSNFGKIWEKISSNIEDFKRGGYYDLLRLIFVDCMEHIRVQPKIEMNGCELGNMSGGQQATLLLKLKLASEGLQKDIIIFDQPENHLDNSFIVKELVSLLKSLKKEKQVIIASHNANAVVSADSEQIIISRMDDDSDKSYISGSLENSEINKGVISILEGGKEAFEQRKKKYNFS